jgi:serine/threonine protein kinase
MLDAFTPQTNLVDFSDIFFVTEYMDRTLDSVIKPRINDHNKISFITYQLLCGVNYLHQANIIHRVGSFFLLNLSVVEDINYPLHF